MQVQRNFSDPRVAEILSTRDEAWIANALMDAEDMRILKERDREAAKPETKWLDHDEVFDALEKRYAD